MHFGGPVIENQSSVIHWQGNSRKACIISWISPSHFTFYLQSWYQKETSQCHRRRWHYGSCRWPLLGRSGQRRKSLAYWDRVEAEDVGLPGGWVSMGRFYSITSVLANPRAASPTYLPWVLFFFASAINGNHFIFATSSFTYGAGRITGLRI